MNAIRRDETLDNLHSVYVDQWDWEKIITPEQRNEAFLRITVQSIVDGLCYTNSVLRARYPQLHTQIEQKVTFITAQELLTSIPPFLPKNVRRPFAGSMAPFLCRVSETSSLMVCLTMAGPRITMTGP